MNHYLFLTGMSRSGTTLLQNILSSHERVDVLSQPIPLIYRYLKKEFYREIDHEENHYVLNHLFNEQKYTPEQLLQFLERRELSRNELEDLLKEMEEWSGQKTLLANYERLLFPIISINLIEFYKSLLIKYCKSNSNLYLGAKEILLEEFVPYFLKNKIKTILIIRDPRDVITSINIGSGPKYVGQHRPTLFHIRHWRKSVAIINTFRHHNCFRWIKYEDLVQNTSSCLKKITDFLELDEFPEDHFDYGVRTREGGTWSGNSSTEHFTGIASDNLNKFQKYMDLNTLQYIEYMCQPEMINIGYDLVTDTSLYDPSLFTEPYAIEIQDLDPMMSNKEAEIELEINRRKLLTAPDNFNHNIVSLFYSTANFQALRNSFN